MGAAAAIAIGGTVALDALFGGPVDARKFLGRGWFLFAAQVHKANPDVEKVEYG